MEGVPLEDLKHAWRTLRALARKHPSLSEDWNALTEARRLIEVEVRWFYGELAWSEMTGTPLQETDDGTMPILP